MYVTNTLCGGLGNMMFQMSAAWAYSRRFGKEFRYTQHIGSLHDSDLSLFNFVTANFIKCNKGIEFSLYNETDFSYFPIPQLDGNISLEGYFQSSKYFASCKDEIRSLFRPTEDIKQTCLNKWGHFS